MDDIRFSKPTKKIKKSLFWINFLPFLKKNWIKILIILIILFLIFFPHISGNMIGDWWNNFATSFLDKLTYSK